MQTQACKLLKKQRAGQGEREGSGRLFCEDEWFLSLTTRAGKQIWAGETLPRKEAISVGRAIDRRVIRKQVFVFFLTVRVKFVSVCAMDTVRFFVITHISDMRFLYK